MPPHIDITLLESHAAELRRLLHRENGREAAAYVLFGSSTISADPWSGLARRRLISHGVIAIGSDEFVSASGRHVTWSTSGFMRLLGDAQRHGFVAGIAHTHPGAPAFFSEQDDRNERELARTAFCKRVDLASLVFGANETVAGRLWTGVDTQIPATSFTLLGDGLEIRGRGNPNRNAAFLARQSLLFGPTFNPLVRELRVGVVGAGGTGSAVAMLLARLGVGYLAIIDRDIIDLTNLNRVHGSRWTDVEAKLPKVDIVSREIAAAGLGTHVVTRKAWVGDPALRDLLRSCDVIFGCTDDHHGRVTLNRLAYFYGIPVFDVGLRMRSARNEAEFDMLGRVSVIRPGAPCLLCLGNIDLKRAADEALRRDDPQEFERRKKEAYVAGGGDPAPAVVTFTTSIATLAVDEFIHGLTGFRKEKGMAHNRVRRFDRVEDRATTCNPAQSCPICGGGARWWGRGDITPFLGTL